MAEIYTNYKEAKISYKDFKFPLSITNFSLKEGVKIATYEYAGRNGAEHERVLNYRTFSMSGEFMFGVTEITPSMLIKELRLLNDNKPGVFTHPDFGSFTCIIANLEISEYGDGYTSFGGINQKSYSFSLELYEHTPPDAKTLKEENNLLYSILEVKPDNSKYVTKFKYRNSIELYEAIMSKEILPGVNPVVNSEWLSYDYKIRKIAYDEWKAGGFGYNSKESLKPAPINEKRYKVKPGDSGFKIAHKFNIGFHELMKANKGLKVRSINKGSEKQYWKTSHLLYVGDIIIIPK